ncbi:MAG: hypothetical protein AAF490_12375 [Chloroflexota bacterium]
MKVFRKSSRWIVFFMGLICLLMILSSQTSAEQTLSWGGNGAIFLPFITDGLDAPVADEGQLEDGGILVGIDGLTLGAVAGLLTAPLSIMIQHTTMPILELPSDAEGHGNIYQLKAERDVYASDELTTLVFGLPIPDGVATEHLGIAIYTPADPDRNDEENIEEWFIFPGLVDETTNLLVTTLPYLGELPLTAVLISHPSLDSPLNDPSLATRNPLDVQGTQFLAICWMPEASPIYDDCNFERDFVQNALNSILGEFVSYGFPNPKIKKLATFLNVENPTVYHSNTYLVMINPDSMLCEDGVAGYYSWRNEELGLCFLPNSLLPDPQISTMRHEYFHAVQSAYPNTQEDKTSGVFERWITEGTATVISKSSNVILQRDPTRNLHPVDVSLFSTESVNEYRAQDFWVFFGKVTNTGIESYMDIFEKGATTEDVISLIGSEEAFRNYYWRWVKNQAMVEENVTFDGVLERPCTLQTDAVSALIDFDLSIASLPGKLAGMSTDVVQITIPDTMDGRPQLGVWVNNDVPFSPTPNPDPDIRYKVYVAEETCTSVPDGSRILMDLSSDKTYYVIVSNTNPDIDAIRDYRINFE